MDTLGQGPPKVHTQFAGCRGGRHGSFNLPVVLSVLLELVCCPQKASISHCTALPGHRQHSNTGHMNATWRKKHLGREGKNISERRTCVSQNSHHLSRNVKYRVQSKLGVVGVGGAVMSRDKSRKVVKVLEIGGLVAPTSQICSRRAGDGDVFQNAIEKEVS